MSTDNQADFDLEYKQTTQPQQTQNGNDDTQNGNGDDLPDKFKGKSVKDVVEMYTNLESLSSRQANELGQYRKQVDQILGLRNENTQKPQAKKPVTATELLEAPDKAIADAIENSDATRIAKEALHLAQQAKVDAAKTDFYTKYPDWQQDVSNPAFLQFVQSNPLRANLAQQSEKNFDAANALWSLWEEHKQLVSANENKKATDERKAALKATRTVSNGSSAEDGAQKPVFSRAKLLQLQLAAESGDMRAKAKWNDPEFQRVRLEAYAEGRVK
jgi:hypothetical protein